MFTIVLFIEEHRVLFLSNTSEHRQAYVGLASNACTSQKSSFVSAYMKPPQLYSLEHTSPGTVLTCHILNNNYCLDMDDMRFDCRSNGSKASRKMFEIFKKAKIEETCFISKVLKSKILIKLLDNIVASYLLAYI